MVFIGLETKFEFNKEFFPLRRYPKKEKPLPTESPHGAWLDDIIAGKGSHSLQRQEVSLGSHTVPVGNEADCE